MVWWLLAEIIRRVRLRRNFKHLAGSYRVTRKLATAPEQERLLISVRPAPYRCPGRARYTARVTFGFA
jgi:hypothetical protein